MDVGLLPARPPFRLADRAESARVIQATGFEDIDFADFTSFLECPIDDVIAFLEQGTVRMTMVLRAQSLVARRWIEKEIGERLARHAAGGQLRLPMPAIVVAGTRR